MLFILQEILKKQQHNSPQLPALSLHTGLISKTVVPITHLDITPWENRIQAEKYFQTPFTHFFLTSTGSYSVSIPIVSPRETVNERT